MNDFTIPAIVCAMLSAGAGIMLATIVHILADAFGRQLR